MSKAKIIQELENKQLKTNIPGFNVGDTIKVQIRIIEGDKERNQTFQGTVIGRKGSGLSETFVMHRIAYGQGMIRTFLLHSPRISSIEVVQRGKVRRAKLYYLRGSYGKKAKVKGYFGSKKGQAAAEKATQEETLKIEITEVLNQA